MKMKRHGFGLIEFMICAALLAIFAALIMPKGEGTIESSKKSADQAQISAIASAISLYKYEIGSYPSNLQALTTSNGIYGPWRPSLPSTDMWGNTTGINGTGGGTSPYCYAYTSSGFAVWSIGENRVNNSGGGGSSLPTKFYGDDYGVIEN